MMHKWLQLVDDPASSPVAGSRRVRALFMTRSLATVGGVLLSMAKCEARRECVEQELLGRKGPDG